MMRRRRLVKKRKPKEISFRRFIESLPRPHPDPQIEWHISLYHQYTNLKRKLEKMVEKPLLSSQDLDALGIVRGAEFQIDEAEPIDIEPRFFVMGSPSKAAGYIGRFEKRGEGWPCIDPQDICGRPLYYQHELSDVEPFSSVYSDILVDWVQDKDFGRVLTEDNPYWVKYRQRHWLPSMNTVHEYALHRSFIFKPSDDMFQNPDVSHSVAILEDTFKPDDSIRRSELLNALLFLRHNLSLRVWTTHHTFPLLAFSFYQGGGRILQMHWEYDHFHVRVSRHLNLISGDDTVPADGQLVIQWLLARPIGTTQFDDPQSEGPAGKEHDGQNEDAGTTSTLRINTAVEQSTDFERPSIA
ncbi:hypothetical protein PT974_04951 [Cladobotryum mycophilum]|uniref:Uncharacterized protein n=1 Tax=Cladobotryum mycophilum TaxID=491253 RepID=A0ABR0SRX7_9HYPO